MSYRERWVPTSGGKIIRALALFALAPVLPFQTARVEAPAAPPPSWPEPQQVAPAPHRWSERFCAVKVGVRGAYLREQTYVACTVVDAVWRELTNGRSGAMITGMAHERIYAHEDYHREGWAADFRTWNVPAQLRERAHREACRRLRAVDPRFRLVLFVGVPGHDDHMHSEFRHDRYRADPTLGDDACEVRRG